MQEATSKSCAFSSTTARRVSRCLAAAATPIEISEGRGHADLSVILQAELLRHGAASASKAGDFDKVMKLCTKAIQMVCAPGTQAPPKWRARLLCDRSMAYLKQNEFELALSDATWASNLAPNWNKTWYRISQALRGLGKVSEANEALKCALDSEPDGKNREY